MAKCKGCGATIEWVKTERGQSMPVNPEYIEIDLAGSKMVTVVTDAGKVESGSFVDHSGLFPPEMVISGRVSHFATCPKAKEFRER